MTIQIPISAETEAKLREKARALGKDITSFILEVIEQKLSEAEASASGASESSSDPIRLLQGLDPDVWKGIDPLEYQRREREGWD